MPKLQPSPVDRILALEKQAAELQQGQETLQVTIAKLSAQCNASEHEIQQLRRHVEAIDSGSTRLRGKE